MSPRQRCWWTPASSSTRSFDSGGRGRRIPNPSSILGNEDAHRTFDGATGLKHPNPVAWHPGCHPVEAVIGVAHGLNADIGIVPGAIDLHLVEDAVGLDNRAESVAGDDFGSP